MSSAIAINNLYKNFGPTEIIRGVDLSVKKGEKHALIGPNGAGKSTLFNLISGLYPVTSGNIRLFGQEIQNLNPHVINRMGLSRSFQVTNIFPRMTVFENVRCGMLWANNMKYSFLQSLDTDHEINEKTNEILDMISLTHCASESAGLLSYADQRALEIGISIAGKPHTLLLDEPTAGMSASESKRAVNLINKISKDITLILVEHDMGVVFDLADTISVLVYGKIICSDTPEKVRTNNEVKEAYLGKES